MKNYYQTPSREPPPGGEAVWKQIFTNKNKSTNTKVYKQISEKTDMKKERAKYKQQDDRVLKNLSREDRQRQERLRKAIMSDPLFAGV